MTLIDTFPAFLSFWDKNKSSPVEEQLSEWEKRYIAPWPELHELQLVNWQEEHMDWRTVAREYVLPKVGARLGAMREAHGHLVAMGPELVERAQAIPGFSFELAIIVYVGLACGAGWVTRYGGKPAVLFGLEMIAECGWSDRESIAGLISHELGHVAHMAWRAEAYGESSLDESTPLLRLYAEGVAQRAEHLILGAETWHESRHLNDDDWLFWCRKNRAWLAGEFMRRLASGEDMRPFFGSWFEINGRRQTEYFLGHELVVELEQQLSFKEIALLPYSLVAQLFTGILTKMAEEQTR